MDTKTIVVPALSTAGGAGLGAGGIYVSNVMSSSGNDSWTLSSFSPLHCTKGALRNAGGKEMWSHPVDKSDPGITGSVDWDSSVNPLNGCMSVDVLTSSDDRIEKVLFELWAQQGHQEGVVVWSILSKGSDEKVNLVSRVMPFDYGLGRWSPSKTRKGLEFTSEISIYQGKIEGLDATEIKFSDIFKDDNKGDAIKKYIGKTYTWTKSNEGKDHLFSKVKIKGDSDALALLFGQDIPNSNASVKLTGVYDGQNKWKKYSVDGIGVTKPIFDSTTKGTWMG